MSYSVFPANLWVRIWCSNKWFHTTKAEYHQACPYPLLKPPWLIRSQWSMDVNGKYFSSYIEMDLYNQYRIPTIYTLAAAKQVGLNSFPPNSVENAFHRSNPTNLFSLRIRRILWFLRFPIFGEVVFFLNGEGLDLESVQRTKGKWAEQLGRRWRNSRCSANAWWWWWRFFVVERLFYSSPSQKSLRNRFS